MTSSSPRSAATNVEERIGDAARERWVEEADPLMDEVAVLPGARHLLVALRERGHRLVLASSGKPHHVDRYLDLLDARELAEDWTTSEDVESTKPAPDLLQVALEKLGEPLDAPSVMIGDSVFDVAGGAATRACRRSSSAPAGSGTTSCARRAVARLRHPRGPRAAVLT